MYVLAAAGCSMEGKANMSLMVLGAVEQGAAENIFSELDLEVINL